MSTPRLKASVCDVISLVPYSSGVQLLESLIGVRIEESTSEDIVAEGGKRIRVEQDEQVEAVKLELVERAKTQFTLTDVDFAPNQEYAGDIDPGQELAFGLNTMASDYLPPGEYVAHANALVIDIIASVTTKDYVTKSFSVLTGSNPVGGGTLVP